MKMFNLFITLGSEASRLPVVLFIHGDSFSWGSGNLYDGSGLAAFGNIVVVTMNYRLGILGKHFGSRLGHTKFSTMFFTTCVIFLALSISVIPIVIL